MCQIEKSKVKLLYQLRSLPITKEKGNNTNYQSIFFESNQQITYLKHVQKYNVPIFIFDVFKHIPGWISNDLKRKF